MGNEKSRVVSFEQDPIGRAAIEYGKIVQEAESLKDGGLVMEAYERNEQMLFALTDDLASNRAKSYEGALGQAVVLVGEVEQLLELDRDDPTWLVVQLRSQRLAYSLVAFIERTSGLKREDYGGEWCASRAQDPFKD